jgi:very-short-patch-repair endonuclease
MNAAQCELVKEKIDALARENPDLEAWRIQSDNSLEPFFVKNLENVQGDERDAIFISTVYGRDAKGSMFQRFGPINQADGHRRLNVLITRAKFLVRVFSSMSHNDIVVDEKSSRGVQTLRGFLQFAADGTLDAPVATGREPDSEFERSVLSVLTNAGYQVVPQVGVAGYFIDIGVRNPFRPGEFILGVECDGARYHSSRSARDRDRLRQDVLEQRDWRIHRIWSLDWFESKSRESERLLASVRRAIEAAQSDASPRERVPDGG